MKKVGRNEPCPCGSGSKYKKCCLATPKKECGYFFDAASIFHQRCIAEGWITSAEVTIDFNALIMEALEANSDLPRKAENFGVAEIKILSSVVEEKLIETCSDFSAHELFFWIRRIKPINRYDTKNVYIYHELMKVASFAFGRKTDLFSKIGSGETAMALPKYIAGALQGKVFSDPIPPEVVSILLAVYRLEEYCFFYVHLANCSRILVKGGIIQRDHRLGIVAGAKDPQVEQLIDYYDSRLHKASLLTTIGSYSHDQVYLDEPFSLVFLQYNFENQTLAYLEGLHFMEPDSAPNFAPAVVNLRDFHSVVSKCNHALSAVRLT